ncbi:DoxX family protein [Streptomyces sp. NBC_01803]|uniref:DoxX family protein n=1 Tax=Streptomyces sp. NBC_01803 TaxID=2975946 RepID=UPI002DDA9684|nr:DoxX family protein [Streptomyces sp. NBC_01803]WSA45440.1 DoxX family protein [Streptomyces sp. NBC_01803]
MFAAYVAVTVLAVIANAFSASMDFVRHERVLVVMEKGHVPPSWMIPLGALKAAGALGLLAGFAVPLIGTAAAAGLVLFFLGALVVHLRAHHYEFGNLSIFLSLASGALAVGLAHHGAW